MFILIFEQLLKMFFIMVLAFVCFKIGLVDQTGNKICFKSPPSGRQSGPDHHRLSDEI